MKSKLGSVHSFFWIYLIGLVISCAETVEVQKSTAEVRSISKINGICLEGPPHQVEHTRFDAFVESGANWVAITPYAFLAEGNTELNWNSKYTWWGEKKIGVKECVRMAKQKGFRVMLKPHIWISHGKYTGALSFESETDWTSFEKSYKEYLVSYLEMFSDNEIDLLCIATELDGCVKNRPDFWKELAHELRDNFDVPLTYSANWDAYQDLKHWSALDYIGISAYFPLEINSNVSKENLISAWNVHKGELAKKSNQLNKPILFTEYGYRSITNCYAEPWVSDTKGQANETEQTMAYEAIYDAIWDETWFAGGFSWKWYLHDNYSNDHLTMDYSIQDKEALDVLKKRYTNGR